MHHLPFSFVAASAAYTLPACMATAVINEQSLVPVGIAVTCCIFLGGLIYKAGRVLQRIEDRLDQIDRDVAAIKSDCSKKHP